MNTSSQLGQIEPNASGSLLAEEAAGISEPKLVRLPLELIDPDPDQPRQVLGELTDLALSIRQHGLLNPIIVEATSAGRYRILAGGRRYAACRKLRLESVNCLVRSVEEQSRLALQLIENIHRKELSPIEEARGMRRLMDEFNLTQRELAQQVGKSVAAVNQTLRILDLDPAVLETLKRSAPLSKSVLLEITKEPDPKRQRELLQRAQAGQLTVRDARQPKPQRTSIPTRSMTIRLPDATVVIRHSNSQPTKAELTELLRIAAAKLAEDTELCSDA